MKNQGFALAFIPIETLEDALRACKMNSRVYTISKQESIQHLGMLADMSLGQISDRMPQGLYYTIKTIQPGSVTPVDSLAPPAAGWYVPKFW